MTYIHGKTCILTKTKLH